MLADPTHPHIRSATVVFDNKVTDGMCLSLFDVLTAHLMSY